MLNTPMEHFREDIERAKTLLNHALQLPEGVLSQDILRASWMMGVGAADAYFCDAYADLISRTLRAKDLAPTTEIPNRLANLRIPVTAFIRKARGGWRWRMAARELIEFETVLGFEKIKKLFNHFFRDNKKLFAPNTIEKWITHTTARQRCFAIDGYTYGRLSGSEKTEAKRTALDRLDRRFASIFHRRHDCIHNCDRPKMALQQITATHVQKVLEDIEFLISRIHESLSEEFPVYLRILGFSGEIRSQVLQ